MTRTLSRRPSGRSVLAVLAVLTGAGGGAVLALSPPASAAPASTGEASIRAAHFAPGVAGVDVYLTSFAGHTTRLWHGDETYGGVSAYLAVPAGQYVVSMRPAGSPASIPAMLSWNLRAAAGDAYTAAAIGSGSTVRGVVLDDDLALPEPGHARVRLIQAASNAPQADVVAVSGPTLATDTPFGTSTGYAQVMAGTWPLQARSVDPAPVVARGSVSVPAGSVTSIVLLDGPGRTLLLHTVLDAASARTALPTGPVDAGGGGTAPNRPSGTDPAGPLGVAAAALVVGIGAVLARRRRVRS